MQFAMVREKIERDANGNIILGNVRIVRLDEVDQTNYVLTEMKSPSMCEYVHKDDVDYFSQKSR